MNAEIYGSLGIRMVNSFRQVAVHCKNNGMYVARRWSPCEFPENQIYSFKIKTLDGGELDFSQFKGKLLLLVNTASQCGFTKQYEGLEKLYRDYQGKGLVVVGFPCNQFGGQEPGESDEIVAFCQKNYGVSFPMSEKVEVNGPGAHPLFAYLTKSLPGTLGTQAVKWNFTKFLIGRDGKPMRRYGSVDTPEKIGLDMQALSRGS